MDVLKDYQRKLFPYAYNILGSAVEANDVIQDVIVNHLTNAKPDLENETGYLIKSVVNRAINVKKRSQKTIQESVWLPKPVETTDSNINKEEIISYSMLILLEKLNPKERAVFILKEAFDYSHEEIALILSCSMENSRKLLSRAKVLLKNTGPNFKPSTAMPTKYLQRYVSCIKDGDINGLIAMLADDIVVKTDGGRKIKVANELTIGISDTSEQMLYVYRTYQRFLSITYSIVDHQPALLFYNNDTLVNCQVFEIEENKIKQIYSIVDPAKLKLFINL